MKMSHLGISFFSSNNFCVAKNLFIAICCGVSCCCCCEFCCELCVGVLGVGFDIMLGFKFIIGWVDDVIGCCVGVGSSVRSIRIGCFGSDCVG